MQRQEVRQEVQVPAYSGGGGILRFFLTLAFVASFSALTYVVVNQYLEVEEVTIPNIYGLSLEEAFRLLDSLDLEVRSYPENVPGARVRSVTSQVPSAGAVVRRGRVVSIGIHTPPADATVANIVGMPQDLARETMTRINLVLAEVVYEYSTEPDGQIIRQSPAPGIVLATGSSVTAVVSRGEEVREIEIPALVGLSVADAKAQLETLGVRRVEEVVTSIGRGGAVSAQSPSPGTRVLVSAPVTIFYALSSNNVVSVPNLRGQSLTSARNLISSARLSVGWINTISDANQPAGVLRWEPNGYTLVGSPVALTVNNPPARPATPAPAAPAPAPARAPAPAAPAPAPAPAAALAPAVTELSPQPALPAATLPSAPLNNPLLSNPAATPAPAAPAAATPRSFPIRFNPADHNFLQGSVSYRLVVIDARGERVEIDRTLSAGQTVDTTITIYGRATLQTYINGHMFQAWSP